MLSKAALAVISSAPSTLLVTRPSDKVIRVILNRPKAFNALSLPQAAYLKDLYENLAPDVTVVMEGMDTGKRTKSFCSGGDVREIWEEGMWRWQGKADPPTPLPSVDGTSTFFHTEYQLNTLISRHPSQLSIWDGICMGGGVGLSVHGSHRVSTSRTVFAMPETGIGLFPDVGGSAWLPRLGGGWGYYLGLTGERIGGRTARRLGVSNVHVEEWNDEVRDQVLGRLGGGER
ncbi:hypothetical protein TrRE_jg7091 [Triparma retinervis]|uniref:3-hydroxyisobutyryl-CoA hydrolase n=1 Tax=Triparma retinervis TaxID=2557542 RepID=A0A9W7A6G1_9STRA|nr:hypothetical protein TrRE_jg7091 [Triparma retinervis]